MRRAAAGLMVVGLLATLAFPARSDDMKEACATSFESGQRLRREGKLRAARKELVICAAQSCPEIIAPACGKWLQEVDAAMPTVVVVARGPKGDQVGDVRVLVDGELVASTLDGKPLAIDPGKHRLRYERDGVDAVEEEVIINVGDHNRRLEPTFKAPREPAGSTEPKAGPVSDGGAEIPPPSGPVRWPAYLTIGLGGAGLVVGAITGGLALSAKGTLDEKCATKATCPADAQEDIDTLSTMSTVSTVGFVVGGIVAAAGIVVVIALPGTKPTKATAPLRLEVSPGGAKIRGRF